MERPIPDKKLFTYAIVARKAVAKIKIARAKMYL